MYSVSNTLYFYISKNITKYTFVIRTLLYFALNFFTSNNKGKSLICRVFIVADMTLLCVYVEF